MLELGLSFDRTRKGASPENYVIFRHIALNIIRKDTSVDASIKRKRHMAALNDGAFDMSRTLALRVN